MTIYDKYAEVYDASGQIRFSLRMIPYVDQLLERQGLHVRSALDLACGTGTVAIALAAKGWTVYVVGGSGFPVVGKYDCFTFDEPCKDSIKVMWVARKGKA
jgi:SAM-dependent methyltransferase